VIWQALVHANHVQRLGDRLDSTFFDGGVHPRFGTRDFRLPLQTVTTLELWTIDHTVLDASPFDRAVSKRAAECGGWLTWVVAVDDVSKVEAHLGRQSVDGHLTKPGDHNLLWKQISVLVTLEDKQLPFFIEWKSLDHPSKDSKAIAKIVKVEIAGDDKRITDWLGNDFATALGSEVVVMWLTPADTEGEL
jgi:hypothetical protein